MAHALPLLCLATALLLACAAPAAETDGPAAESANQMLARAASLELDTEYEPPPGDPLEHHASGFAKILCSAVFITGLDVDFAASDIGAFTAPFDVRDQLRYEVDGDRRAVHVDLPNGTRRTARQFGDQGCVTLPVGADDVFFEPKKIASTLPEAATTPWPLGDVVDEKAFPAELDRAAISAAVDAAFEPSEGLTAALVVTWRGQIVGERYRNGIDLHTSLESWSMGKSLTATLMGLLIQRGVYQLDQLAPVPEWQYEGDARQKIRISDILRMSSGLRFRAPQDPDFDPGLGYPDHLYVYTGSVDSFQWAATRPQQWPPNTVGRYRNSDPVLINYLVRLGVESEPPKGLGEDYHSFPQRALFDKLGVRDLVMEPDPYGNFLLQGYEFGTARDWARLGNLYLNDGVWDGERLLPEGWVDFVSTVAPAWQADGRPIYGGFFWINGDQRWSVPDDAYYMAGAGGQYTIIVPSHDLVVVRLGHYSGGGPGVRGLNNALSALMTSIPSNRD